MGLESVLQCQERGIQTSKMPMRWTEHRASLEDAFSVFVMILERILMPLPKLSSAKVAARGALHLFAKLM
jgi:hypothetical protein